MKKLTVMLTLFGMQNIILWGQPGNGDWRTRASGNWNDYQVWQVFESSPAPGDWRNALPGEYPLNNISATVTISENNTLTSTHNLTGTTGGKLIISEGGEFTTTHSVSGNVSGRFPYLEINGILNAQAEVSAITFILGNNGVFKTSYSGSQGWWNSTFVPISITLNGTVEYCMNGNQVIASPGSGNLAYNDLVISGTGKKYPANSIIINGLLTVCSGGELDLTGKSCTFYGSGISNYGLIQDTYLGTGGSLNFYNSNGSLNGNGSFPVVFYEISIGEFFVNSCNFYLNINNEIQVKNLYIDGTLTLSPTSSLTVLESVSYWSEEGNSFVLESDGSGCASLIIKGDYDNFGGEDAIFQRYISTPDRWHIISSPLPGETLAGFLNSNPGIPSNNDVRAMTEHDTSNGGWQAYFTNNTQGNLSAGKGFLTRIESGSSLTFSGPPLTGNHIVSISDHGKSANCIGNPYTSSIGISTEYHAEYNFLTYNTESIHSSYQAVYVWNEQAGYSNKNRNDYIAINHLSEQDYIQPGQGFFVIAAPGAGAIHFTPQMQAHQNPAFYKKSSQRSIQGITLIAEDESNIATTSIVFLQGKNTGLDPGYDAGLFGANEMFSLYTHLIEDNGIKFMIQCLPDDVISDMIIPVGFDIKYGNMVTFSAEYSPLPPGYKIVLEDKQNQIFTDLKLPGHQYSAFIPGQTSGTGRFFLHIVSSVTGIIAADHPKPVIFTKDKELVIQGSIKENTTAGIYDISGKLLKTFRLEPGNESIQSFPMHELITGIYIVKVSGGGTVDISRLFLD